MTSNVAIGTSGRTTSVLAGASAPTAAPAAVKRSRDESTNQADQNGAISRVEGEGAAVDGVPIAAVDGPLKIVRASTRFEVRIKPEGDGLALLKALDSVTGDVARARNAAVRANMMADGAWLDAHPDIVARWKGGEKKLEWWGARRGRRNAALNPEGVYSYPVMRAAAPLLNPSIAASLQSTDDAEWIGSRFDVLVRCAKSPRFYKPNQPIRIPHAVVKLVGNEDGSADVTLRLMAASVEDSQRYTFHLVPRDAWQREELSSCASGAWKLGDVVISRDATHRGRWYARLCYTRFVERAEGGATVVVRRGMRSFLVAASSSGECRSIYDGGDLIAYNKQMMARRRGLGENTKRGTMGSGATGHGTKRRVGALIDLSDKEGRFKADACKRAARALVLFAQSVEAKEVVYEDFAAPKQEGVFWLLKRWPWDQLSRACQNACEAAGMPTRAVIVHTDRRVCPSCGYKHAEPPVSTGEGVKSWECFKCTFRRAPDQIDALDMLRTVCGGEAVARVRGKSKLAKPKPPTTPGAKS